MYKHTGRLSQAGIVVFVLATMLCPAVLLAEAEEEMPKPKADLPNALDAFKKLAGTWKGTVTHHDGTVKDAAVTYAVTAAGTAVIETLFCDAQDEMVTMYFMAEGTLTMTHYCAVGNQPTMESQAIYPPGKVVFHHNGGTNITSEDQPHMHHVEFQFLADDHIVTDWTFHVNGEPGGVAHLDLKRQ